MGCDIHLFIEYKKYDNWWNFGEEFHLDRDYLMFGMMARGVRTNPELSFAPRGLPTDIGWSTKDGNTLYISDDRSENSCTLEDAKSWGGGIEYHNDEPYKTTHPDWHSHSWLTKKELEHILGNYRNQEGYDYGDPSPDYYAIHAVLDTLEQRGRYETRIVFWFDN